MPPETIALTPVEFLTLLIAVTISATVVPPPKLSCLPPLLPAISSVTLLPAASAPPV